MKSGVTNTEYYVHDGGNIVADLDVDKNLLRSYSYALGYDNIISMTSYSENETNSYFYIRNHINSVVALIDEDGNTAESYEYTAYGEVTVFDSNGNELDESALGNRYTFQGREIDWSTGLYNFRARYYDPDTGRWLSKDPIGINGGLNQYTFCGNNPVMFGDPLGWNVNTNIPPDLVGKVEGLPYPQKGGWPVWYEMQETDYGGYMYEKDIISEVNKYRKYAKENDKMVESGLVAIASIADPTPAKASKPFFSATARFFVQFGVMFINSKAAEKAIDDHLDDKYDKEPIDVKPHKTK